MAESNDYIVAMEGINKAFPGVQALANVDFFLRRGEIHAIMGENGAGKSTLIKVLTGVERPDSGRIILDGHEVVVRSPLHAQQLGISTVYQEINLCPNLTVAENILIGREPRMLGTIRWRKMNAQAETILQRLDIDIDVTRSLGTYSVAVQQLTAIARALEISAKVLILDEPTSSLDANDGHFHHPFHRSGLRSIRPNHDPQKRQSGWDLWGIWPAAYGIDFKNDRSNPDRIG
jgi:monosaccharide-transporting ATPase